MDIITLATTAIALVTPFFVKGAEEFAKEAGKDIYQKTQAIKDWLWSRIQGSNDSKLKQTTHLFEDDPTTFGEAMTHVLSNYLQDNPTLAGELAMYVQEFEPKYTSKYNVTIGKAYGVNVGKHGRIEQSFYRHGDEE